MTLPKGWVEARLDDLAEIKSGITLGKKRSENTTLVSVPYLRVANVQRGRLQLDVIKEVEVTAEEVEALALVVGDILLNEGGDRDKLGRGWVWEGQIPSCIHQNHVFRARLFDRALSPYFVSIFANEFGQSYFLEHGTQTTNLASISKAKVSALPVPLPPEAEQRRIVAKLDALTARLARARAELDRVPVLAEKLRRKALADAFEGALSASWRAANPSAIAVQPRARSDIRAKFQTEGSAPKPYSLPGAWRWLRLPELGDLDRGKSRHRPRNDPRLFGGSHPFIQTGDVRSSGQYLTSYTETYSDFGLEQSRKWEIGTVCITIAANIAETTILGIPACFPDSVVGFVADEDRAIPEFIEFFIRTAKADLSQFAPATAQKNINLETLATVAVPVPPIGEQRAILDAIQAIFAHADRLEAEAARARALLDRLEAAVLAKAFRGELVPQDPNDEPAQTLLDRIRNQRAAAPKAKRGRKAKEPA